MLDLSAAFDTVDHSILLRRLHISFGFSDAALAWFSSYLNERQQSVFHQGSYSVASTVKFGVPQGSVLGPILFIMYTADIVHIIERYGIVVHQYADDTQVYGRCRPGHSVPLLHDLGDCVQSISRWMSANRLQLNSDKTEFMWCVPPRRRHQLPAESLMVDAILVQPVVRVRDLGVYLDSDMSMSFHISHLVSSCFGILRQIRCIRRSLTRPALTTLVTSFILTKVDYCNVALTGLPRREIDRVQSVINAAARLTANAGKFEHVSPLLADLHWLRVPERIQYKLCVLVHRCLHGAAPLYLSDLLQPVAEVDSRRRRRLRSASTANLVVPTTRRSTIGDRAFAVAGPRAWNSLPAAVHQSPSLNTFKKNLKTFLFSLSFPA